MERYHYSTSTAVIEVPESCSVADNVIQGDKWGELCEMWFRGMTAVLWQNTLVTGLALCQ